MSLAIKSSVLSWLRYARQMPYIATEVGCWNADCAGSDGNVLVELEIKTSMSDLRRDFENKTMKHGQYLGSLAMVPSAWVPHRMYFVVPGGIAEKANTWLAKQAPAYGVMVFNDDPDARPHLWHGLSVLRRAKRLHDRPLDHGIIKDFVARMASDICHFYIEDCISKSAFERVREISRAAVSESRIDLAGLDAEAVETAGLACKPATTTVEPGA